jgi:hypothetical protein
MHARSTSFYVGIHLEKLSKEGRPVGQRPEVYRVGERESSAFGRQGRVIRWSVVEPLASIMQEGMRRFLSGASLNDLAVWTATTELAGPTPTSPCTTFVFRQ